MQTKTKANIEDYRMYKVTNFISILGIPAHISFIPLFFYLGYDFLAYVNFISTGLWIYARVLNEKGQLTQAITVLIVEVVSHAVLATINLGSQSGFQYYFFGLIPFAMFHQKLSKQGFIGLAVFIASAYFVSVYLADTRVHDDIEPLVMNLLYYGNVFVVMLGITLMSIYFREASVELEDALKERVNEREVLIREVHHRVKNNMQIIISLLHLQGDKYNNEISEQIIQATESRINSMLLVHEKLFQNESLTSVDVGSYIESLADDLKYNLEFSKSLDIQIECDEILFHIDKLIPIGLIVNEAVTNCVKYANFPELAEIKIRLERQKEGYILCIKDNGCTEPLSYEREGSIGVDLISGLAKSKLKGSSSIHFERGTIVEIIF